MRQTILAIFAVLSYSASAVFADAKADLQSVIDKLAAADSYSWSTAAEAHDIPFGVNGKSQKGVLALTIANFQTQWPAFVKDGKFIIQASGSWQTPEQIIAAVPMTQRNLNFYPANESRCFKPPAALLADILASAQNIQFAEGVYTADLGDPAAKEILADTRLYNLNRYALPTVTDDSASVQIWVANGVVTKYQAVGVGTVTFNNSHRHENVTVTTEISNIGSTTVDVPPDALAALNNATTQPTSRPN